jgi:hypothetical protein
MTPICPICVLVMLTILGTCTVTQAQTPSSRFEAGVQGSLLHLSSPSINGVPYSFEDRPQNETIFGLGGRGDWNFSRYVAIEGELDWYPRQVSPNFQNEGGRTVRIVAGPKLSIYRGERWGLFGTVRPGLVRFGQEYIVIALPPSGFSYRFGPVTNFALDFGGGLEVYPTKRLIPRFDVQDTLIAMYERTATLHLTQHALLRTYAIGGVRPSLHVGVGLSYRFGRLQDDRERNTAIRARDGRFEVGGQFGSLTKGNSLVLSSTGNQLNTSLGGGGRFTYNLRPQIGLDATLMYFPNTEGLLVNFQSGGNTLEGLFGVKAGLRKGKVGYFAKARPGFLHFDKTLADFNIQTSQPPHFSSITHPVLDVGAVVELYTSRRTMLRFDAGDTIWWIGSRKLIGLLPQQPTVVAPGDVRHMIQLTTGFGVRF